MSDRTRLNMFRWFMFEVVTIIIAGVHIAFWPTHRSYGIPLFIVVCLGLVAWGITWLVLKSRANKP